MCGVKTARQMFEISHLHFSLHLTVVLASALISSHYQHTSEHRPPIYGLVEAQSSPWNFPEFTHDDATARTTKKSRAETTTVISTTLLVLSAGVNFFHPTTSREIIFIVRLASESWQRSRSEIAITRRTSRKLCELSGDWNFIAVCILCFLSESGAEF